MQKTRRLTSAERWELGLFLSLVIVACLCVTAILNLHSIPRLFAFSLKNVEATNAAAPTAVPAPVAPTARLAGPAAPAPLFANTMTAPVLPELATVEVPELPTASRATKKHISDIKWFGGKEYRFVKTLRLRVTAYAPDTRCCWPYPGTTTASGLSVKTNHGRLVAADTKLIPMHALVAVPGYASGAPVPVLDRGGAIKGHRLDVLMPNFDSATDWGSRMIDVKIYMPVEE